MYPQPWVAVPSMLAHARAAYQTFRTACAAAGLMSNNVICMFVLCRVSHRYFFSYAARFRGSKQAVAFLHALPKRFHTLASYNLALKV